MKCNHAVPRLKNLKCRSRKGAWIEIVAVERSKVGFCVAPVRERGLKSLPIGNDVDSYKVAPVRERGLKYRSFFQQC